MPKLLTTTNKVGNFMIREQWRDRNFCREDALVAVTGLATAEVGAVVMIDEGTTTEYIDFDQTTFAGYTAGKVGIIVDERIDDPTFYSVEDGLLGEDTDRTLALLVKGDAIVRLDGLIIAAGQEADAKAALEAQGITVQEQLKGRHNTDVKRPFVAL